ncbi:MAG TPA: peptidylprolyl isomerase [Vicinamibacterales bacterium]|nr:peptidylprolyl isomerase [Vicinamibacterales bacterium]
MNRAPNRTLSAPAAGVIRATIFGALAAALLLTPPAAPAFAQGSDPVVAKVDGVEVRESDIALAEEDLGSNIPAQLTGDAKRDFIISYLADILLVAKSPETRKAVGTIEFQRRLAFVQNKLMMETMLQSVGKDAVNDKAMRQVYDDAVKQMSKDEEVRARHILVPTEAEAKAILDDLKKGANFETVAKEKSKDPGAAAQGGDLGYFTKDQMVPEFAEVAFKLPKGEISDPVKSQFGWHIIKVEDKRTKTPPSFEQVKDQVETFVQRKAQAEYVTKLRESAKIERLDKK